MPFWKKENLILAKTNGYHKLKKTVSRFKFNVTRSVKKNLKLETKKN